MTTDKISSNNLIVLLRGLAEEHKMIPYKSNILVELPRSLEKRLKLIEFVARQTAQENRARPINKAAPHAPHACSGPTIRETYPELAALWQWLILKYSSDQPRVPAGNREGGQWTKGEGSGSGASVASTHPTDSFIRPVANRPVQIAALETGTMTDASSPPQDSSEITAQNQNKAGTRYASLVIENYYRSGNPLIDRTSDILFQILARDEDLMARVTVLLGRIGGALYGTLVHIAFARDVRALDIPGIGRDGVEQSFSLREVVSYGTNGSIRTDVVLRDGSGIIIAIWDVKTGNAELTDARRQEIRDQVGALDNVPVIELHICRGLTCKPRRGLSRFR